MSYRVEHAFASLRELEDGRYSDADATLGRVLDDLHAAGATGSVDLTARDGGSPSPASARTNP